MNESEKFIREKYEARGYSVIHIGVPDFILLKDGEIEFVEVKKGIGALNKNQERAIALLRKHGFDVKVERVPKTHHSSLLNEWRQTEPGQTTPVLIRLDPSRPNHTRPNQHKGGEKPS